MQQDILASHGICGTNATEFLFLTPPPLTSGRGELSSGVQVLLIRGYGDLPFPRVRAVMDI